MSISRIVCAYFSPTGGTKRVALALQKGFLAGFENYTPQITTFNSLTPARRSEHTPQFTANDLLVFAYPVFYGRMPWALQDWPQLQGNGASAIVVSVYGNRAIEDGERETMAMLKNHGFKIVGRIEAIAEHSLCRTLAAHRPDEHDQADLRDMAQQIMQAIVTADKEGRELKTLSFDETTPLKPRAQVATVPQPLVDNTSALARQERCVVMCPCGIIDPKTLRVEDENLAQCMNCTACMHISDANSRGYPEAMQKALQAKMAQVQAANQEPKPYVLEMAQ